MDAIFFISIGVVGIISVLVGFLPQEKLNKRLKISFLIITTACLMFQGFYGLKEKRAADCKNYRDGLYQNDMLRGQGELSDDMKELKEKSKKGILTEAEYGLYISNYLESIDLSLKRLGWKHTRERIIDYYEEIAKIPDYFTFQEWGAAESFIYNSIMDEINNNFSARNMYDSGVRTRALESFKRERERLITAKERDFNKVKE